MKITGLSTRLLEFDPSARYRDGRIPPGRPKTWCFPLVAVHTDEGVEGYSMAYGPHGDGPALADTLRQIYQPLIVGENPLQTEQIWRKLALKQRHLYNQSASLMGVIDVAIWDLKGKILGRSLGDVFGLCYEKLACYATSRSEEFTEEEVFEEAGKMKRAGFHGYKLQLRGGPDKDIPRLRAAREAMGPQFPLMQDPNGAYDYDEALRVGYVLDELNYLWYEEPIRDQKLLLMRHLQDNLRTPLLVGETAGFEETHLYLNDGAFCLIRADALIKGGLTGLRKIMAAAEVFGVRVEIHTANTPLLDIAHLHAAGAYAGSRMIENHHPIFRFAIKDNPLEPDLSGYVHVPREPGLGVSLDWDWIENHTASIPG